MQQIFNKLIKQNIKPFLSMLGYNKKSLNFYKTTDNLNYMFNFQKSANNMFYMNCYIYATELAHVQSKEILTASKEAECHFRARIESIVEGMPNRFSINPTTNMDDLRKMLLRGMKEAHHFFESMTNARSIINYYTSSPFLHLNDVTAAKRYYHEWQKKHGTEQRWAIFEKNIRLSSINLV